ncbi:MAG: energy transducer TonB [Bacteroidales bacterium]|nr:energy transducer TonB [Bacteroidales bacterium]
MEIKKSEKANLEHLRSTFMLIGLMITLSVIWLSFEYKTYDKTVNDFENMQVLEDEEDIVIQTERLETPPPPPPQQQTTVIEIVEDDVEVDIELEFDAEMDEDADIEDAPIIQQEEEEEKEEEIFVFVEEQAGFPGGEEARMKYLRDNTKYPQMAKESGIQGTVYLKFVVEKDGRITNIQVVRGIGGGCDEEAVRVLKSMPKWQPAKQRGRPVRVWFNMPFKFILQG